MRKFTNIWNCPGQLPSLTAQHRLCFVPNEDALGPAKYVLKYNTSLCPDPLGSYAQGYLC